MNKKRKAFTLIELLVVILILAILAALIVPRVVGRASDAKRAKAASDISTLSGLLQQFHLDNGRFPTTEEGLESLRTAPADARNWRGPYLQKPIPLDPWQNEYVYEYPGMDGEESFILLSYGADGQPGGEGDNADISEGLE
jgi:general secretion pathway protein G